MCLVLRSKRTPVRPPARPLWPWIQWKNPISRTSSTASKDKHRLINHKKPFRNAQHFYCVVPDLRGDNQNEQSTLNAQPPRCHPSPRKQKHWYGHTSMMQRCYILLFYLNISWIWCHVRPDRVTWKIIVQEKKYFVPRCGIFSNSILLTTTVLLTTKGGRWRDLAEIRRSIDWLYLDHVKSPLLSISSLLTSVHTLGVVTKRFPTYSPRTAGAEHSWRQTLPAWGHQGPSHRLLLPGSLVPPAPQPKHKQAMCMRHNIARVLKNRSSVTCKKKKDYPVQCRDGISVLNSAHGHKKNQQRVAAYRTY